MHGILFIIISFITIPILMAFLGLQIIEFAEVFKSGYTKSFQLSFDLGMYSVEPYTELAKLLFFLTILMLAYIVWINIFSQGRGTQRFQTLEERKRLSHLARSFEAKRGTVRLEFDRYGYLKEKTFRSACDDIFNPFKKLWNTNIVKRFKLNDRWKLNQIKQFNIGDKVTRYRSGIPIIVKKNRVYVDADDNHCLIVGTTNSGKTYGVIDILIELTRMTNESMVINDVKGELYRKHAGKLKEDGYKVLSIDFTAPRCSDHWNLLALVVKKYHEAEKRYLEELKKHNNELFVVYDLMKVYKKKKEEFAKNQSAENEIELIKLQEQLKIERNKLPTPNYSEAYEMIADISKALCEEKDAKEPFWSNMSETLLQGLIAFLLEEKEKNINGEWEYIEEDLINMNSVKMLHMLGKTKINPKLPENLGCQSVLELYVKKYRNKNDYSTKKLSEYFSQPDKTRGNIDGHFDSKIQNFLLNDDVLRMMAYSDIDFKDIGKQKSALFIGVHDEKSTFHKLVTILISQIYEELVKDARNYQDNGQRLPVPVNIIWDEFANGAYWGNISNALAAGRSRGIRFYLVIQDYGQLRTLYGEKDVSIKTNCADLVYLLAGENTTLKDVSDLCGNKQVWNKNRGEKETVPVLSPERLRKLSLGEAVFIRQRMNPVLSRMKGLKDYVFKNNLSKPALKAEREAEPLNYFDIHDALARRIRKDKLKGSITKKDSPKVTQKSTIISKDTQSLYKEEIELDEEIKEDDIIGEDEQDLINDEYVEDEDNIETEVELQDELGKQTEKSGWSF